LNWAIRTRPVTPLGQAALHRDGPAIRQIHQALLEVAVVVALEQHDHLAPGDRPGQADGLGVGLGGRERELPLRNPVAAGEFLGHLHRGLRGQQELRGPRHLRLHRGHDRRMGMPAEHRHIRGVEVDIAEPVDVSEARALPIVDVNRLVIVRCHPRHRHAIRHMRPRPADQRQRPRPGLPEAGQLLSEQLADPRPVKITMCRHTRMLEHPPACSTLCHEPWARLTSDIRR
jgi:hypothetical protein